MSNYLYTVTGPVKGEHANKVILFFLLVLQGNESPKHKQGATPDNKQSSSGGAAPAVDSHVQLKYENDRLKLALAQRYL